MYSIKWRDLQIFFLYSTKRYKSTSGNRSSQNKKVPAINKALSHFDEFYGSVFGNRWESMRKALHRKQKYVALVNNYGEEQDTVNKLQELGAHDIKRLFEAQKNYNNNCQSSTVENENENDDHPDPVENFAQQMSQIELDNLYGSNERVVDVPSKLDVGQMVLKQSGSKEIENNIQIPVSQSLSVNLQNAVYDESRIIDPSLGLSATSLWTYVPATRLKGREDWLPESQYFSYYQMSKDFPLVVEKDDAIEFPEHLKVYSFEPGNDSSFPTPRRGKTNVFDYYMMDGSSILPVIALGVKGGDRVLDLCAAPGGKSLAILQTLMPGVLIANDLSKSRINRLQYIFNDYLYDFEISNKWRERVIITQEMGQLFEDQDGFDKILVDVPCTNDRLSIKESDNNIFKVTRIKDRVKMPELQSALLSQALSLCRVGGTVVYSTCSFSPIQNDGVVHMALKNVWENKGIEAKILTTNKLSDVAKSLFKFGKGQAEPKYGQLVVPHILSNFGPLYYAKIVRTR